MLLITTIIHCPHCFTKFHCSCHNHNYEVSLVTM